MPKKLTRVDIPVVNAVADELVVIGGNLIAAFGCVQGELDENWGCWGHDATGNQFGDNFAPNVMALMVGDDKGPGGTQLSGTVKDLGDSLHKVTEAFAQLDAAAGDSLTFDE
jgi:hypothetical protein